MDKITDTKIEHSPLQKSYSSSSSSSSPSPFSQLFWVGHLCPKPQLVSIFHMPYVHTNSSYIILIKIILTLKLFKGILIQESILLYVPNVPKKQFFPTFCEFLMFKRL